MESEAVCTTAGRPPSNLLTGQSFMMGDIDWVSLQMHSNQSNHTDRHWLYIAQCQSRNYWEDTTDIWEGQNQGEELLGHQWRSSLLEG